MKSAPSNLPNYKIWAKKAKMPKVGTKNALFGYFWARILNKLLPYFESAPSNLLIARFLQKTEMAKFRTKNALFGYFWARI